MRLKLKKFKNPSQAKTAAGVAKLIYGIYKNVRDAAWKCLIDFNITSLPVDLLDVAGKAGIKVIKNGDVRILSSNEIGKCIYDYEENKWYLIYDDECTSGRRRFTIAHELGHIFLGHELIYSEYERTFSTHKTQPESEADMFASRLLAPACVLWALDVRSAEEIASLCDISQAASQIRAKRMQELYKRNKFLTTKGEQQVYEQFKCFIERRRL